MSPLLDQNFLKQLYASRERTTYVKIISLDMNGAPQDRLEGIATGGTINIDGASSVRRSCSLTLVTSVEDPEKFQDIFWGLSTEIKLYIGLENKINKNYPSVIWFPMGHYLISTFSYTQDMMKYTINISGKDKMCKLNGELGGQFTALTQDLGQEEIVQPDGSYILKKLKIRDIIVNLVNAFGLEPLDNIIINDLDINGMELLEYRGATPLYLYKDALGNYVDYTTVDNTQVYLVIGADNYTATNISNSQLIVYERPTQKEEFRRGFTQIYKLGENQEYLGPYTITKIEYGDVAGYHNTDLVYAGELTANLGEAITSVLDKIKTMLVNYEYFYNTDGQFVFQKKPSKVSLEFDKNSIQYILPEQDWFKDYWNFEGSELITQIGTTTPINNIKNDYTVWGMSGNKNIHMRYAVNQKPVYYKSYDGQKCYATSEYDDDTCHKYDWRELIYQMAYDQHKYGANIDFKKKIRENNIVKDGGNNIIHNFYPYGTTGYESYYVDQLGFWRQLYNPDPKPNYLQVAYNEDNSEYNNRWIDEIIPYADFVSTITDYSEINKKDLYKVFKLSNGQTGFVNWLDTVDLTSLFSATGWYALATNKTLYFYTDIISIPDDLASLDWEQGTVSMFQSQVDGEVSGDQIEYLNRLYVQRSGEYVKIIDTLDLNEVQIFAKDSTNELTYLVEALTESTKEKVYISKGINGPLTKYIDGYSVLVYKDLAEDYEPYSPYFWYNGSNKVYQISLMGLGDNGTQSAVIWEYVHGRTLSQEDIELIATAVQKYRSSLKLKVSGIEGDVVLADTDILSVRGKPANKDYYFWYKENEQSNPISLYDKVLTYDTASYPEQDKFSKYQLYLGNFTDIEMIYIIDYLDIDKKALWLEQNDGSDMLEPWINTIWPESFEDLYVKTGKKMNIVNLNTYNEDLRQVYLTTSTVSDYASSLKENFYSQKLDLRGNPYIRQNDIINAQRIPYYYQYYEYYRSGEIAEDSLGCWNKEIHNNISKANYWLDFLSLNNEIGQHGVNKIGLRQKTQNINTVTGIDFGSIPNIMFVEEIDNDLVGYSQIQINEGINSLFTISARGASCLETIENWVGQYLFLNNTVTITAAPIYQLEPNIMISLTNKDKNINGDYEISKITIPLSYNGTMTLSCNKILNNVY